VLFVADEAPGNDGLTASSEAVFSVFSVLFVADEALGNDALTATSEADFSVFSVLFVADEAPGNDALTATSEAVFSVFSVLFVADEAPGNDALTATSEAVFSVFSVLFVADEAPGNDLLAATSEADLGAATGTSLATRVDVIPAFTRPLPGLLAVVASVALARRCTPSPRLRAVTIGKRPAASGAADAWCDSGGADPAATLAAPRSPSTRREGERGAAGRSAVDRSDPSTLARRSGALEVVIDWTIGGT
jgi:hypothetical protein